MTNGGIRDSLGAAGRTDGACTVAISRTGISCLLYGGIQLRESYTRGDGGRRAIAIRGNVSRIATSITSSGGAAVAEIIVQDRGAKPYRARTQGTIEVDYHDRLGRLGIEAVAEDGRTVVLYLSLIEACGLSAGLRSEIGAASERIEERRISGNVYPVVRYNARRR
jgi:hypothetical protein